jgi:Spy/CpxP family protein refolding chaperone
MGLKAIFASAATVLMLALPAAAQAPPGPGPGPEQIGRGMGEGGMHRGGEGPHWGWHSGRGEEAWARPLITMMLHHREEIGLSPSQTASLEHLRTEFMREVVRRQADQGLARLDLAELLRPDPSAPSKPVDMGKVEAKIRDIAGSRADLAINRIRTIEQAKSLLTGEQRSKLDALLTAPSLHRGGPAGPMRPMAPPSGRQ